MTTKLTLSIDEKIIARAKEYARVKGLSLSALVENHLRSLVEVTDAESYSPLVRSLKGAIRVDAEGIDYKEILEEELLKKFSPPTPSPPK